MTDIIEKLKAAWYALDDAEPNLVTEVRDDLDTLIAKLEKGRLKSEGYVCAALHRVAIEGCPWCDKVPSQQPTCPTCGLLLNGLCSNTFHAIYWQQRQRQDQQPAHDSDELVTNVIVKIAGVMLALGEPNKRMAFQRCEEALEAADALRAALQPPTTKE